MSPSEKLAKIMERMKVELALIYTERQNSTKNSPGSIKKPTLSDVPPSKRLQ